MVARRFPRDLNKPESSMAADTEGKPDSRAGLLSALVLSASALATAYASYQAALWDGEQGALYTSANGLRVEASKASLRSGQVEATDLMAFGAWLSARAENKPELEDFYVQRFRPEFARVFAAWIATSPRTNPAAPPSPFAMPDYDSVRQKEAEALEQKAQDAFAAGQDANDKSDAFVLATVILANAMFFGGINQIPHNKLIRGILLWVSVLFCVLGIVRLALLPPAL
jgi:hypothetical protein